MNSASVTACSASMILTWLNAPISFYLSNDFRVSRIAHSQYRVSIPFLSLSSSKGTGEERVKRERVSYEFLILGPRPNRQLEHLVLHVLEACVPNPPVEQRPRARFAPDLVAAFEHLHVPFGDGAVGFEGAVVGVVFVVKVLELGPAAWCGVSVAVRRRRKYMCAFVLGGVAKGVEEGRGRAQLVGLSDEAGPVSNRDGHVAAVDEVEWGVEGPFAFDIVDFELDVRWDPGLG